MEGKPFEEKKYSEMVEDYFTFINHLPLPEKDRKFLSSLIDDKKRGKLTITQFAQHTEDVVLDPTMTEEEIADAVSDAFDTLYSIAEKEQRPEELAIRFEEMPVH